jgi:hypothetical protein
MVRIDKEIALVAPEVEDGLRRPVWMAELAIEVPELTEFPARRA